jgi:hypothetical protein
MQFISWLFLIAQAGIVIASLLGYGIFTSRPDLLVQVDPQARFFTWAFHGFAVGNMLFGGLAVVAESVLRDRKPAIVALATIYIVSLTSEMLDYRASQNPRISGSAIGDMPFSGLGPVAGSGHEQGN